MQKTRWNMSSYPRGWFVIAYGPELGRQDVLALRYFGQDLILFRGKEGTPALLDAYCAHLGTHLGVGGVVEDGYIRCPMHGWRFNDNGECVSVPYADTTPNGAKINSWPVREGSGLIWTWYDPNGLAPTWEPPEIPEYDNPNWTAFSDEGNRWIINSHAQIVQENACDIIHLREFHGMSEPEVDHTTTNGPLLTSAFTHKRSYPGAGMAESIDVHTSLDLHGLGFSKQNSIAAGIIQSTSLCLTTPIDENQLDLRMASSVLRLDNEESTDWLHKMLLETTRITLEEDIPIWESRDYRYTGFFKNDQPLTTFRRWSRQFYDELAGLP
jgi:phenylpropionate dioxygenase-like ring-hydroxylating dioxygenase large terminal subunit